MSDKESAKRIREDLDLIRLELKNFWKNCDNLWFRENLKMVFQYLLEIIQPREREVQHVEVLVGPQVVLCPELQVFKKKTTL